MNGDDYKERIERMKERSASDASSPSKAISDAFKQKLLQEVGQLTQQLKNAEAHAAQLKKTLAEQSKALDELTSAQRRTSARIHKIEETQKAQPKRLSEVDAVSLIGYKLLVFKVQLACLFAVVVIAVGAYLAWQDSRSDASSAPQEGVISSER